MRFMQRESMKYSIKTKTILSIFLIVAMIAGQFFITSGISAKEEVTSAGTSASTAADATSKSKFTPAEGWENYDYFNFAEALQKSAHHIQQRILHHQ